MAIGISSPSPVRGLERSQDVLERAFRRLSSLQRITRAGEDPAGLALSEQLRASERSLNQGTRNLSDGISLARTADGALASVHEGLGRLRELTVAAGNGALSDSARGAIQAEFDQVTAEISRTAGATQFGGRALLDGSLSGADAATFRDGTGGDAIALDLPDISAASLGIAGLDASDPSSLDAIDTAISTVSAARGQIGATSNRFESAIHNSQNLAENTAAARSRIADADVAAASAELARGQILRDFGLAVRNQANISARAALALLR